MRNLKQIEVSQISGGLTCIDADTYQKLQNKAVNDGLLFGGISVILIGAPVYGLALGPLGMLAAGTLAATAAFGVAPYVAMYGYFNSSTWNLIYS